MPAALLMLPITAAGGASPVLATLVGVNIGPTAIYAGSLATLLWRRSLRDRQLLGDFATGGRHRSGCSAGRRRKFVDLPAAARRVRTYRIRRPGERDALNRQRPQPAPVPAAADPG